MDRRLLGLATSGSTGSRSSARCCPRANIRSSTCPLDHALFSTQFEVTEIPQIPNIGFFLRSGGRTSEQGADSAVPHGREASRIATGA